MSETSQCGLCTQAYKTGTFFFSNRIYSAHSHCHYDFLIQTYSREVFHTILTFKSSSTSFSETQNNSNREKAENGW